MEDARTISWDSDDRTLAKSLWDQIERRSFRLVKGRDDTVRSFFLAREAVVMINGDGIESLFESNYSLEDYATAFAVIGVPNVRPIFDRLRKSVPMELCEKEDGEELFSFLEGVFEEMKKLRDEFFQETKDVVAALSRYARQNKGEFSKYLELAQSEPR